MQISAKASAFTELERIDLVGSSPLAVLGWGIVYTPIGMRPNALWARFADICQDLFGSPTEHRYKMRSIEPAGPPSSRKALLWLRTRR